MLEIGDIIAVDGFVMLKGLDGGSRYRVVAKDGYSYTFKKIGSSKKVRHYQDDVDGWIRPANHPNNNKIIKESRRMKSVKDLIESNFSDKEIVKSLTEVSTMSRQDVQWLDRIVKGVESVDGDIIVFRDGSVAQLDTRRNRVYIFSVTGGNPPRDSDANDLEKFIQSTPTHSVDALEYIKRRV